MMKNKKTFSDNGIPEYIQIDIVLKDVNIKLTELTIERLEALAKAQGLSIERYIERILISVVNY